MRDLLLPTQERTGEIQAVLLPSLISRRKAMRFLGCAGAGTLLGSVPAFQQAQTKNGVSGIAVAGQPAEMRITPVSSHTLRISLLPISGRGEVQPIPKSIVLAPTSWPAPMANLQDVPTRRNIRWGKYTIEISSHPLAVLVRHNKGDILQQVEIDSQTGSVRFIRGSHPVFGLGEGGPQFDRRGATYLMKHGERVPDMRTDGARMPIPWLIGTGGWALFFHLPFGIFDLTGNDAVFQPRSGTPPLPTDLFLVVADEPAQIMSEYARLTGFPHMPPIWALGYQQSHRTLSSRHEVLAELLTFRDKKLPCDVTIYLGTGFCPSGWNLGHGSYEFNPKVFPDPRQMISEMHREHFRIVLHEDKPPKQLHGRAGDTGAAAKDPEDAANYWQKHVEVFDMGVDGWWADEGDWLDDISCLVRNRMYWEGAQLARPNERPYTLNRNGYAGIQRYGWLWSGDITSTWQTLREQIAVGLNTGLSGMPYWGTDTGGFVTTPELTGELYVRWFQFSAFCPLFRSHGRTWKLRLPWGWDTGNYGPIEGPKSSLPPIQDLHNADVEPICRKYLDLRYRLMPYLYTAVREAHDTGMPIMRALWLHYPTDKLAVLRSDEYLWGPSLLIAPVVEKGARSRALYLPRGTWYDFWTEEKVQGGRDVTRSVDLATLPIYVRAGTVLPLAPVRQYATEPSSSPLELLVYPGESGEADIYEDDGLSFDYREGQFGRVRLSWADDKRQLALSRTRPAGSNIAIPKQYVVRVAARSTTHNVTLHKESSRIRIRL